jgi:hypothetical protein
MKNMNRMIMVVALAAGVVLMGCADEGAPVQQGYGQGQGAGRGAGGGQGRGAPGISAGGVTDDMARDTASLIADLPLQDLSEQETRDLIYMWEEEKLASDVYSTLYEVWNLPIFRSISSSEQTHMDSIALLLERYQIDVPGSAEAIGSFANQELQVAYDSLTAQGRESLIAALTVGARIEDLDIADLQQAITESDNDDIRVVYQNLMKGSRNHIRSYVAQLERAGETYEAVHITGDYLQTILAISRETAPITDPLYSL